MLLTPNILFNILDGENSSKIASIKRETRAKPPSSRNICAAAWWVHGTNCGRGNAHKWHPPWGRTSRAKGRSLQILGGWCETRARGMRKSTMWFVYGFTRESLYSNDRLWWWCNIENCIHYYYIVYHTIAWPARAECVLWSVCCKRVAVCGFVSNAAHIVRIFRGPIWICEGASAGISLWIFKY